MASAANRIPHPRSLADVLNIVVDKGSVIDAYVPISLLGIDLATITARVVTAGVDTHLRYAEAVDRLDLRPEQKPKGLPELLEAGIELLGKGVEGTAKTAKKKQLSRPAERVEQLGEKVTDPVGQLVEKVIGGAQLGEEATDPVGELGEKATDPVEQLDEKATGGGDEDRDEDRDQDRGAPASRQPPSRG